MMLNIEKSLYNYRILSIINDLSHYEGYSAYVRVAEVSWNSRSTTHVTHTLTHIHDYHARRIHSCSRFAKILEHTETCCIHSRIQALHVCIL